MMPWVIGHGSWVLAETAAQAPADPLISGAWVISLVVAIIGALAGGVKIGQSRNVKILDQPVEVAVQKTYVSREECLACKNEMRGDVREMRILYDKLVTLINVRDENTAAKIIAMGEQLHTRITAVVEDASERRRRIYDKQEEHTRAIAMIDARTDVSKAIGQLGKAIIANSNRT
jgi:hypothetical protein